MFVIGCDWCFLTTMSSHVDLSHSVTWVRSDHPVATQCRLGSKPPRLYEKNMLTSVVPQKSCKNYKIINAKNT